MPYAGLNGNMPGNGPKIRGRTGTECADRTASTGFAVSSWMPFKHNPDGSLDLYVSPGAEKEANWLPAPKGAFNLVMRLLWAEERCSDWKVEPTFSDEGTRPTLCQRNSCRYETSL
jgi:hypothetical protein